ncbi:MAG: hypothetical protein AAF449_05240, partial [Myxococcota bacterium]
YPPPPTDLGPPPPERGVALGLFSQDPDYRYRELIDEVGATGASHISLTWVWWQENVRATEIRSVPGWSATEVQLRDSIRYARQLDLHVTVFPIVRLKTSTRNEWRGRIEPDDEDQWWRSYEAFILKAAVIAIEEGAGRLSVGSELLTREHMRSRWLRLIERVRIAAPGVELMYSANWDHFRPVRFWDALDVVGLTAYWELTKDLKASTATLAAAWDPVLKELQDWSLRVQRPLVLTEVGYPSLDGGAAWPWDETRRAATDLEEQRRAYLAFIRRFAGQPWLQGVYWWNWFGFGGPDDTNYTPRGKPSGDLIRAWYTRPTVVQQPQDKP